MKKLWTSLLVSLTVTALIAMLSSCAGGKTKSTPVNNMDEATTDEVGQTAAPAPEVEAAEARPENKKVAVAVEDALTQAIKRQSDSDITRIASDLLMVNPTNVKALNAMGLSNYKKGKYKAAEYFLNKALKSSPTESGLYNNLALVKLAQNEQRDGVKLLKAGLSQKGDDLALLSNLGAIYVTQKDYPNAEVALEPVYKHGTKDVKALTNYATAVAANKKYPEATAIYKKLLADNGNSREIMLNYAIHLVENVKDNKQGLELINRLKFVGVPDEARNVIKDLEIKAKAGLK